MTPTGASIIAAGTGPQLRPAGRNLIPINRAEIVAQPRIGEAAGRIEAKHFKDRFRVPGAAFIAQSLKVRPSTRPVLSVRQTEIHRGMVDLNVRLNSPNDGRVTERPRLCWLDDTNDRHRRSRTAPQFGLHPREPEIDQFAMPVESG